MVPEAEIPFHEKEVFPNIGWYEFFYEYSLQFLVVKTEYFRLYS